MEAYEAVLINEHGFKKRKERRPKMRKERIILVCGQMVPAQQPASYDNGNKLTNPNLRAVTGAVTVHVTV